MAINLTKIYTRTGDKGTTRLIGGAEVSKTSGRIDAYGVVDELNAVIGLARSHAEIRADESTEHRSITVLLKRLQNELFDLGCDLATPPDKRDPKRPTVDKSMITVMENEIDSLNENLSDLKSFVLPGGGMLAAFLHQARTVCRRAERVSVCLASREQIGDSVIPYLNRLSDLLFVLSRDASRIEKKTELLWVFR